MESDSELLIRYTRQQSQEAFAELVRRYVDFVYRTALRRVGGDSHATEEVVQDVFVALGRKAPVLANHPRLAGWLHVSACYAAGKRARDDQRHREATARMSLPSESPEGSATWSELRPVLDEMLLAISEREREAVLLRFFFGLKFGEIGAKLGLTEDGARLRVDRALERIRSRLERRGIVSTAAMLSLAFSAHGMESAPASLASGVTTAALERLANGSSAFRVAAANFFMAKKKLKIAGLLLAGLATVSYEGFRLKQDESRLAVAGLTESEISRRLADAERTIGSLRSDLAGRLSSIGAGRDNSARNGKTEAGNAAGAPSEVTSSKAKFWGYPRDFLNDPAARRSNLAADSMNYAKLMRSFFATAGLTPEQQEKMMQIREERVSEYYDLAGAGSTQGLPESDPGLATQLTQMGQTLENEIHATLSDSQYLQFKQSFPNMQNTNVATELASTLAYTSTPLTATQATQLAQALSANPAGAVSAPASPTRYALITNQAIAQAEGFLDPSQLQALRKLQSTLAKLGTSAPKSQ